MAGDRMPSVLQPIETNKLTASFIVSQIYD